MANVLPYLIISRHRSSLWCLPSLFTGRVRASIADAFARIGLPTERHGSFQLLINFSVHNFPYKWFYGGYGVILLGFSKRSLHICIPDLSNFQENNNVVWFHMKLPIDTVAKRGRKRLPQQRMVAFRALGKLCYHSFGDARNPDWTLIIGKDWFMSSWIRWTRRFAIMNFQIGYVSRQKHCRIST